MEGIGHMVGAEKGGDPGCQHLSAGECTSMIGLGTGSGPRPRGGGKPGRLDRWSESSGFRATAEDPIPGPSSAHKPGNPSFYLFCWFSSLSTSGNTYDLGEGGKAFEVFEGNHKFVWRALAMFVCGKLGLGLQKTSNGLVLGSEKQVSCRA